MFQLLIIIKAIWSSFDKYSGKGIDGMYSEYTSYVMYLMSEKVLCLHKRCSENLQ